MSEFKKALEEIDGRFTSSNQWPVERATILAKDWNPVRKKLSDQEELTQEIRQFNKVIVCLALELPESVWNDVNTKWQRIIQKVE